MTKNPFRYEEYAPGAIKPLGHLKRFLENQARGLTGHRRVLGYPYDGPLWERPVANPHFTEGVPGGEDVPLPGGESPWWPYEQTAYLLDGMLRLSLLVDAPALRAAFERSLRATLRAAAPDGHLGAHLHKTGSEWPMAVFFRAAAAWIDAFGAPEVVAAFARHFESLREKRRKWWGRDLLNLEGMLKIWERTGDPSLRADAVELAKGAFDFKRFRAERRIHEHGVSFSESLKLPAILFRFTGDRAWLRLGRKAVDDAFAENEQPSGALGANEDLSGRDPRQGYETCCTSDLLWSLGWYVEADGSARDADRMEKLAYNALPGAVTKDFTALQYLSAVNQPCATPFSNDSHFNFAEAAWRQYRPDHFPQCCPGNVNRAMPVFAQRLWLRDARTGAPCAMLHGPSALSAAWRGAAFRIESRTDYPFGDEIRFVFRCEAPLEGLPFSFRVPSWCGAASLALNGRALRRRPAAGRVATVRRTWRDGDELLLRLPAEARLRSDRNWHWIERGPLTFAYAVPARETRERPGDRFSPVSVEPAGPFHFAFDLRRLARAPLRAEACPAADPWREPALAIRVPVAEIAEWRSLDQNRFAPGVPLYAHPTGEMREIELVPFATTLARVTTFPDTEARLPCPVVAAYVSDAYPYDPARPLSGQRFEPETAPWGAAEFRRRPIPQRDPDQFFDLGGHFGESKDRLAYLCFRFWAPRAGRAVFALGAANTAAAWRLEPPPAAFAGSQVRGSAGSPRGWKPLGTLDGLHEARMMAPQWFRAPVREGTNWLVVKVATPGRVGEYRREWGAKLDVFLGEKK